MLDHSRADDECENGTPLFRVPRTGGLETNLIVRSGSVQFGVKEEAAEVFINE